MLLSLRDDFLMRCAEHEPLAPVFESLTPLPRAERRTALRRALVEPAKKRGYRFEDEALVGEMVESVEGARGALPLLAFAVSRLWEKRDRERKLLTRAAYEEIGGVAGALAQHAEATMDRDRRRAAGDRARDLPQPRDGAGDAGGGGPRGAAVGLPGEEGRRGGAAGS